MLSVCTVEMSSRTHAAHFVGTYQLNVNAHHLKLTVFKINLMWKKKLVSNCWPKHFGTPTSR